MKDVLTIVISLLLGLVVGSWSVKSDLREARKEIDTLKRDRSRRDRREDNLRSVTSMLRIPEPAAPSLPELPPEEKPRTVGTITPGGIGASTAEVHSVQGPVREEDRRKAFEEQIKTAMELWKTRSALARNSFISNIGASPVQTGLFDQTVERMNQRLGEKIRQWTDYVKDQRQVTPETGLRMMNNLSESMITAYDELDKTMPPDWRDKAGSEFQLFDFINPEVALPLADVQGAFEGRRFGHRHRDTPANPPVP